ncbi:hypothetical protein DPMN_005602 [Dreissena polymorpha]|uniref:Uncharacterized protein n=1 Tax=Dreissena polymorpha TaxID=45954 RepID=A0A9D4MQP1_DREPO|nr:hypothetical protein DPMN_005602 [Dreissena polymorpha]
MQNNIAPFYLCNLIPVRTSQAYDLRSQNGIPPVYANTQLYSNSFLPSAIGTIFLLTSKTPIHFLNLREKSRNVQQSRVHYLTLVIEDYISIILVCDLAVAP